MVAVRFFLAAAFLIPGLEKLQQPLEFSRQLENYQLTSAQMSLTLAYVVPWVEVLTGLCLLLGILRRAAALISLSLSLGFGVFVSSALARGLNVECGCFGGASKVSYAHLGLDVVLVLASVLVLRTSFETLCLDSRLGLEKKLQGGAALFACFGLTAVNLLFLLAAPTSNGSTVPLPPQRTGATRITFEPLEVRMGAVTQGETVAQTVSFRNIGTEPFEIGEVTSTCGCTVPEPDKNILAPGESGELTVQYHAGSDRGPVQQSVKIYEKGNPEPVLLQVTANVQPLVEVVPQLLELRSGEKQMVRLESKKEGLEFKVEAIENPLSMLQIKPLDSPSKGVIILEVEARGAIPPAEHGADVWTVGVKTNLDHLPPFRLYLKGRAS